MGKYNDRFKNKKWIGSGDPDVDSPFVQVLK